MFYKVLKGILLALFFLILIDVVINGIIDGVNSKLPDDKKLEHITIATDEVRDALNQTISDTENLQSTVSKLQNQDILSQVVGYFNVGGFIILDISKTILTIMLNAPNILFNITFGVNSPLYPILPHDAVFENIIKMLLSILMALGIVKAILVLLGRR